jgi:4-coumarate--CoA ligase
MIIEGAASVSREVQERLYEIFPSAQVGQAYGILQCLALHLFTHQVEPGIQAQVIKPDGSLARFGERGELVVKGPGKVLGYFGNLQA